MTWNYRLMRHDPRTMPDGSGETWLAIHEVYYDENLTSIGGYKNCGGLYRKANYC